MALLDDVEAAVAARGVLRVYKINEVPAAVSYPYCVVGVGTPSKIARGADGQAADLDRCTVQTFGHDADGVRAVAVLGDLDGQFINGRLVTLELSTDPYRDPDDGGVLNVLRTYRF